MQRIRPLAVSMVCSPILIPEREAIEIIDARIEAVSTMCKWMSEIE
jgi:hypothetical protein